MIYSVIEDVSLLNEIKKVCYTSKDVRASWIGCGIPSTSVEEFKPLAKWALEHWEMYTGFFLSAKPNPKRILDVGCGSGYATLNLSREFDCFVIGVDSDLECINFAKTYNKNPQVLFLSKDIFDFKDGYFDYVFALEILEHIPQQFHFDFIEKCLSLLIPGGMLFLTTPNALDEQSSGFHRGLLTRELSKSFYRRYKNNIQSIAFYDNKQLVSMNPEKFIHTGEFSDFENMDKNRSHFKIEMIGPCFIEPNRITMTEFVDLIKSQNIHVSTIVDIGCLDEKDSFFLKRNFIDATAYAIEGLEANYNLMKNKTEIIPIHAVVADHDGHTCYHVKNINGLHGIYDRGESFGTKVVRNVKCCKFKTLMRDLGLDYVDVLKIDVEGAS